MLKWGTSWPSNRLQTEQVPHQPFQGSWKQHTGTYIINLNSNIDLHGALCILTNSFAPSQTKQ